MRRLDSFVFTLVVLAASLAFPPVSGRVIAQTPAQPAETGDISGDWSGSFDMQGSPMPVTLNLRVDGERVTGTFESDPTGQGTLRNGRWVLGVLSFNIDFPNHDPIAIVGRLSGGKLFGEFDIAGFDGTWQAKRK
ncbi:MAG TPA: hypothetical protein VEZ90_01445 [Blastocatellia bacterium]|nr:hypothetical protein [Blastocatellia bacterium]